MQPAAAPRRAIILGAGGYLLVGIVCNIIVAWRFACFSYPQSLVKDLDDLECELILTSHAETPHSYSDIGGYIYWDIFSTRVWVMAFDAGSEGTPNICQIDILTHGWPLRSMSGTSVAKSNFDGKPLSIRYLNSYAFNQNVLWIRKNSKIPLQPLWPGFLFNSFFYAAGAVGLVRLGSTLKARARLSRRHCPVCNYDLRASMHGTAAHCPECGRVTPSDKFNVRRLLIRRWMVPWLVPLAGLMSIVLLGGMNLLWVYHTLRFKYPILNPVSTVCMITLFCWAWFLCWNSYADRPTYSRATSASLVALVLSCAAYVSTYVIWIRFTMTYP